MFPRVQVKSSSKISRSKVVSYDRSLGRSSVGRDEGRAAVSERAFWENYYNHIPTNNVIHSLGVSLVDVLDLVIPPNNVN